MTDWLRISVERPSDEESELLTEGLLASGGTAVEERDGKLVTYVAAGSDPDSVAGRVRAQLAAVLGMEPPELEVEQVPEQDWLALWRSGLAPRRVGRRIVVSPSWSDVEPADGELVIRIDPQMAFGTGEHASTRGVLRLMQDVVEPGSRLLDVGSGSAILSIAAAMLGAAEILAVESDPDAMENAGENVALNGVAEQVTLECDLVDDEFLAAQGDATFHGILANVLSSVLLPLLPAFHGALRPGGWAILSGILVEEAPTLRDAAVAAGFAIDDEDTEEQWWTVRLRRP